MSGPRSYRVGGSGKGYRSFSPVRPSGAEPRSAAPPVVARKLWRDACEAAGWDAASPDQAPDRMARALRELGAVPFPLENGDLRGLFAAGVADQWRLYVRASGAETRRRAAPLISAGARMLHDLLMEQGAELATAWRNRTGQKDD